uniref:Uncharacterized protein isoform X2 n=1 Tax=Nicotiana tabacum TaxID=4097 RepID=A0A1S4CSN2_TOBAC|nr:PREDICTED: uncharacterized protein LOC107822265 isoform X2 [Nicotiana tabacum]
MLRINACLNLMILLFIFQLYYPSICSCYLFCYSTFVFVHLKGMLRDITKGGRHVPFDKSEPRTPDIKLPTVAPESSDQKQYQEDMREAAENFVDNSPVGIGSSSADIDEEDNLDELANASGTEFEIPASFDEQIGIDSHMGADWPGT